MPDPTTLLLILTLGWLAVGLLAPLETLGWYAGWFGTETLAEEEPALPSPDTVRDPQAFIVFLSGIHVVAEHTFAPRERAFLDALRDTLPHAHLVEVFPYSVTNRPLTGQRLFARFWRAALNLRLNRRGVLAAVGAVINLRNAWQVAVSADHRYGPMYDEGSAALAERALARAGYDPARRTPVVLVGYSGGGQIALGAATPLAKRIGRPVRVVSLGGVMASPRDLTGIERIVHLRGRYDRVARLGAIFFPGRWWFTPWSTWNRARATGIIDVEDLGPMDHTGPDGYLDEGAILPDGRTHRTATLDAIVRAVTEPWNGTASPWDAPSRETSHSTPPSA